MQGLRIKMHYSRPATIDAAEPSDLTAVDDMHNLTLFPPESCPSDVDGGGDVGFTDLVIVLARWGPGDVQCVTEP